MSNSLVVVVGATLCICFDELFLDKLVRFWLFDLTFSIQQTVRLGFMFISFVQPNHLSLPPPQVKAADILFPVQSNKPISIILYHVVFIPWLLVCYTPSGLVTQYRGTNPGSSRTEPQHMSSRAGIYHTRQDPRCRLCKEASQTVQHIVAGCEMQTRTADMNRAVLI